MAPNIAVIYHSRNGTVRGLAEAAAEGASAGGADVRLLRVRDDEWYAESLAGSVSAPTHDDLLWADGLVLGTPTYYGNISHQLKRFIDSTSELWKRGALADRAVTGMTSSNSPHGGREATLLTLYHSMYHWGALIVSAGGTDPVLATCGSNPYGVAAPARADGTPQEAYLSAARTLGLRLCGVAARLAATMAGHGRVAVIYHAADGSTAALAAAIAQGAVAEGAEVRLRRVGEPLPGNSIEDGVPPATLTDLDWADAVALGGPARVGTIAPRLLQFIEDCEPLRAAGRLDGKTATGFVTTPHQHSGSETALLALYNAMHHWGAVIVPPGYTDPAITAAGGNPYGISYARAGGPQPDRMCLDAARFQGGRLARLSTRLRIRPPPAHSEFRLPAQPAGCPLRFLTAREQR